MKIGTIAVLVGALCIATVHGEDAGYRFEWVTTNSGPNDGDSGVDIAIDADDSILIAGHHSGLDLDRDGIVDVRSRGSLDGLVIKSRQDGIGIWLQAPGGPQYDTGTGIAVDRAGGSYATGSFRDSIRIGQRELRSKGPSDGYLIRHSTEGDAIWTRTLGGDGDDSLTAVESDSHGNAYVTGMVRGAVDLDGDGTADAAAGTGGAALLASFTRDAGLRWAWTPSGRADSFGWALHVSAEGDVYIGGTYRNGQLDLDHDGRYDTPSATSETDAFIARFDANGKLRWVRPIAGPAPDMVRAITLAGNGDLLVTGGLYGASDFDGDGTSDASTGGADRKTFLARYRPQGELAWIRVYGPETTLDVAAHGDRIVLTGHYKGPLDFDGDGKPDAAADPDGESEGFSAVLDAAGNLQHLFTIVGPAADQARSAAFSQDGEELFVTGFVRLTADFDGDGVPEGAVRCDERGDMFIAGYRLGAKQTFQ